MRGLVASSVAAGQRALVQARSQSGVDRSVLAEELFVVTAVLDGSASLRRALADPSRDGAAAPRPRRPRSSPGKVSEQAVAVVLRAGRASAGASERDLTDTIERARRRDRRSPRPRPAAGSTPSRTSCSASSGSSPATPACASRSDRPQGAAPRTRQALVGRLLAGQGRARRRCAWPARPSAPRAGASFDRTLERYLAPSPRSGASS